MIHLKSKLISQYSSDRIATDPRDTIPETCSASMMSLCVNVTTIAIGAVRLLMLCTVYIILNTTISSVRNLCIVKCRCFVDLLANELQCVHCQSPEILG